MSALLQAANVSKRFGGVLALSDVSFGIERGEIYGPISPNGAGKTTLFNVLTGLYAPDAGGFAFDGQPLAGLKPHEVTARGIARTFQNIRLFANLSALENVMIERHVRTRAGVAGAIFCDRGTRAEESMPASYTWKFDGEILTLKVIKDECADRVSSLDGKPWKLIEEK